MALEMDIAFEDTTKYYVDPDEITPSIEGLPLHTHVAAVIIYKYTVFCMCTTTLAAAYHITCCIGGMISHTPPASHPILRYSAHRLDWHISLSLLVNSDVRSNLLT
jgi:hypothetical protein